MQPYPCRPTFPALPSNVAYGKYECSYDAQQYIGQGGCEVAAVGHRLAMRVVYDYAAGSEEGRDEVFFVCE